MSANIQIGQLPQTNTVVNTMQFPVEVANVTQKIYATSIKNYVTSLAFLNSAGNVTAGNLVTAGNVYATGVFTTGPINGNLSTTAQANITRLGNLITANVSGNVTAGNVSAVKFTGSQISVVDVRGTLKTNAQPYINSVGPLASLVAGTSANVVVASSAPSTSTTTGALVVVGGAGVGGDLNIGGAGTADSFAVTGVLTAATANPAAANLQVATTEFVKTYGTTKADLNSPTFTGTPVLPTDTTAVTQAPGDTTTKLATTAFVQTAIFGSSPDLAPYAPKVSPVFTGSPSLPTNTVAVTQAAGDNSSRLATTAFVNEANVGLANNISNQLSLKAPLANPNFTGIVTGITKNMVGLGSVDNVSDANKPVSTATQTALNLKAPLANPAFTGTPTAPTAAPGTVNTQIATTEFVAAATSSVSGVPTGSIFMWPWIAVPSGYLLCNGQEISRTAYAGLFSLFSTSFGAGDGFTTFNLPDFRNRMPIGVGTTAALSVTGGSKDAIIPSHTHTANVTLNDPGHYHNVSGAGNGKADGGNGGAWYNGSTNTDTKKTGITVAVTNSTEGESGTNKNLPPYLGINFIIKA